MPVNFKQMNNPLVSIALCTYNGERFLQQQLNSLINQSYPNLEIIIVDDGSTDGTIPIIKRYAAADPRVKLFENEQNLGLVKNFEKAIYLCTGEYIALCDQDDTWMLNKIEQLVVNIGDNILIYHNSQLVDEKDTVLLELSDLFNMYQGDNPLAFIFFNCIPGHTSMFKKELVNHLKINGPFDPAFYHDWWIAFIAACYGSIKYIDKILVNYRQHAGSETDLINIKAGAITEGLRKYREVDIKWLRKCYTVNERYKNYIGKLISVLEKKRMANVIKLFWLLVAHQQQTYFMKKKDRISKINYLRKGSYYIMTH